MEDIYKVMHIFFPSPRVSLQDVTMNLCISQLFPLKVLLVYKWNGRNCILCLLSTIFFFSFTEATELDSGDGVGNGIPLGVQGKFQGIHRIRHM